DLVGVYDRTGVANSALGRIQSAADVTLKELLHDGGDEPSWTALEAVFDRLEDDTSLAAVLNARIGLFAKRGALPSEADPMYRLAAIRFAEGDTQRGADLFERALLIAVDPERAEEVLLIAFENEPRNERLVRLYERVARAGRRERTLAD